MRDSWGAGGPRLAFACAHLDRLSLHLLDIQCPSRSDAGPDLHTRRGDWEARKPHQPMMPLALEAHQATGTQDGAAADFAPVVISDVTWSHSLQRGLPVHDLEGPRRNAAARLRPGSCLRPAAEWVFRRHPAAGARASADRGPGSDRGTGGIRARRRARRASPAAPCATRACASHHACWQAIRPRPESGYRYCPLPGRVGRSNVPTEINRLNGWPEH
jgi:hypothetical protein